MKRITINFKNGQVDIYNCQTDIDFDLDFYDNKFIKFTVREEHEDPRFGSRVYYFNKDEVDSIKVETYVKPDTNPSDKKFVSDLSASYPKAGEMVLSKPDVAKINNLNDTL